MPEPDFERLNRLIKEAGAEWEAGSISMSRFFGERPTTEHFGLSFDPVPAAREAAALRLEEGTKFATAAPPPRKLDWRRQGGNFVTAPKDQSSCGSCVAFATVGCLESRTLIAQNRPGGNLDLSEAHLFYCGAPNSCGTGWYFDPALQFAMNTGVGLEAQFPYTPGNQPCRQIPPAVRVTGYARASSRTARKEALTRGPVIGGMQVFDDFMTYRNGVYRHVSGNFLGWHAVLVIGYDDEAGYWIAKNSWSAGWGENGFFRIAYGQCSIDTDALFYDPSVAISAGASV
jgi:C1A family cysteine protease